MYKKRYLETKLKEAFSHFSTVVVSGARQVGKSTLLEELFGKTIPRVVFDPISDINGARADPDLFLANYPPPLILDEIQYIPEVVPALKRKLERDRRPGQYLITGSQQWQVMRDLLESLAGRAVFFELSGFSLGEIAETLPASAWLPDWLKNTRREPAKVLHLPRARTLIEQIWRGSLPESQTLPLTLIANFFASYVLTYVERDVRLMAEISDVAAFGRFFRLCGALTGQEMNFNQLGREIGLTPQTARRWLDYLKATFQWFELPAYAGNTIKRISGKPKGYMTDTGLACWSLVLSSPEALSSHPAWGAIFESAVVAELVKQSRLMSPAPVFYYWRTHGGSEVDILLEWNGRFYPIELKAKSHPSKADASGIHAFRKTYPKLNIAPGLIVAPCESAYAVSLSDMVLPWDSMIE